MNIFTMIRALTYASIFIAVLLVFVPARLLEVSGIARPESFGVAQILGAIFVVGGSLLAVTCVLTFATIGRGTPMPLDPPRRLVVRGPYVFVRNPMYIGAVLALVGAALFFNSVGLFAYALLFFALTHVLVVTYEEPALRRTFGLEYEDYCRRVHRWRPRLRRS